MVEDNKKRIQRKIDKVRKHFEKLKFRTVPKDISNAASFKRVRLVLKIQEILSNAEYGDGGGQHRKAEQMVGSVDNMMQEVDEIDGVEPEAEQDESATEDIKERLREEGEKRIKESIKKRTKEQAKKKVTEKVGQTITKKVGQTATGFVLKNPWVLGALTLVLLVILLIVAMVACSANKSFDEDGGSAFLEIDQQNSDHQDMVSKVRIAVSDGGLVLASNIQNDILGDGIYNLDYRVVQMLEYLSSKYKIGVNILYSNAPDYTYRQNVSKEALELDDDQKSLDAYSAYKFGQAVGINSVGTVSPELAKACDISGPVYVKWQEMALEGTVRSVYEQLQVNAYNLYVNAEGIADTYASGGDIDDMVERANVTLELIQGNVSKLTEIGEGFSGIQDYITKVNDEYLSDVSSALNLGNWSDADSGLMEPVSTLVQRVFRMMQVANMDRWYGSTDNGCRMWKAFEARQNIRRLVGDVMRMPIELAGPEDEGFNNNFVVKQLIVYSPEDDLDNGPMDWDVFPPGITSVGIGGVAIGSSEGGDGVVDYKDNHFMSLPIDNGVFSKACTEFVYVIDDTNSIIAQAMLTALAPEGLRSEMCRLLYGNERASVEGEISGLVSYKKFIHIGF